jgi:LysR family hca operon transcriptional activator
MEIRHLRYFVAVAEAKSLTLAAEERLHTSQPSLSRQIRDLEDEVGTALLTRSRRGIELTAAGTVFLEHARAMLAQIEVATVAARHAAQPVRSSLVLGFLTGHEVTWMPEALRILRDELPNVDVTISSQTSPELAIALRQGRVDAAVMRREERLQEPLMVFLPSDHGLARQEAIAPEQLVGESFLSVSGTAPVLRRTIEGYLKTVGVAVTQAHDADNLAAAMSLIASTGSVALLPAYAKNFLPWSVTFRPLTGEAPTIDLVVGYAKANQSAILRLFLSRLGEMAERGAKKVG